MRKWWNWQTHHLEGVAPTRRAGSSPAFRTFSIDIDENHQYNSEKLKDASLRIIAYSILLLTLCVALAYAGATITNGSLSAWSDGNYVHIAWSTSEESGVTRFEIDRKGSGDAGYVAIGSVAPNPNRTYEFIDYSAFKTSASVYEYQITVVSTDGRWTDPVVLRVSHNVSSVKRTWGSLKAMFR